MNLINSIYLNEIDNRFLPQLRAIDCACLQGFWTLDAYQREIDNPSSYVLGLVNDNHELLGFGCLWSILEEAHITVLAVRPEYQGQGLGKALVWGLLNQARDRQLEWATLEVRDTNAAAIAVYQSFDFQEVGRRVKYYEATGEDALILWRKGIHQSEFADSLKNWRVDIHQRLRSQGWDWQSNP